MADLRELPFADASFSVAVCGLALSHLPSLDVAVSELARVLAPGGRLVVSVLHPFQALLGWHAPFSGADGSRGFVREHPHLHGDYLAAFAAAGLEVTRLRRADDHRTGARHQTPCLPPHPRGDGRRLPGTTGGARLGIRSRR